MIHKKTHLSSYITGIFESCGTIYINKNNNKYPRLYISFHHKNKLLAESIKERLGFGAIYTKTPIIILI